MAPPPPEAQLTGFINRYTPEIASLAQRVLDSLRAQLPGAVELVYDNYNALAIGFSPTERVSDIIVSVALYPRWVSLFFMHGAHLADPHKLLTGSGKTIRHTVIRDAADLEEAPVQDLMAQAIGQSAIPLDAAAEGHIIIKSVSAKQRPRRPRTTP